MILAAALLLGTTAIGWWSPWLLGRLAARVDPRTAIAWWLLTAAGVVGATVAGVLLLVLPGHGPADAVLRLLHDCWAAVGHDELPALDPVAGTIAGLVLAAATGRQTLSWLARRRRRAVLHRRHLTALRLAGAHDPRPVPTLWLPDERPIAYSLGGRRALVVASDGLAAHLTKRELGAVLAHERAHVLGHHHLFTSCAEVLGRTLRFVPLMRELPAATRLLVELAADQAAAAQCGRGPLRSALVSIRAVDGPRRALAMAGGDTAIRLSRLDTGASPTLRPVTVAGGIAAFLAPPGIAVTLVLVTGFLACR
ncbi:peptidase M48 [Amycolatopsis mediterranei S699]|uniref:Peptidase M48 n=2 Tax=Amycolatopsis mediterranei TaxID=33910 RepID=A0A0H3D4Y2_AMYMU|nr:M56 family metallopeptidase [Amycolatopsis mediterranei]ADJ45297.1 peptidase M48 [Amycolatopsis mediterranei U32]AEK42057.1 peptidase M48 [Amycolatopsis mediterranei S699]AFO77008.1 peptidase M48 [Amycolatopsis mediterranei S699]AGT84136.1 peptidase M48 [Amycolatopsis mediterranei RB]KDO08582.1 peptidase M48 [Amycolatopsis mediterranei]